MTKTKNKLYLLLSTACLIGYIWIYFNLKAASNQSDSMQVCLFKHATDIPCPSCGSSRSIIALFKGDFAEAFYLNPMGYLGALFLVVVPFWMIHDWYRKKSFLFDGYKKLEASLKKPKYALLLMVVIALNWIWNITKGI